MAESFDLVVIGAGPAGEKAATQAAYYKKRVAVVERRPTPGGIAVSDAGIPTKTLRETAQYLTGFRHREVYGISLALDARMKLERLMSRAAEVRGVMTAAVQANLEKNRITLIQGTARLAPGKRVLVGDRVLEAERILIATGSRPIHPSTIPFDDAGVADSERILELERLPKRLVVVGGGAVGCEYASIFTALGVEVTLLECADRLLAFMDAELSVLLAQIFRAQGVALRFGASVSSVAREDGVLRVLLEGGESIATDQVLFAGGRAGNTEGLALEEVGVAVDAKGRIKVDEHFATTAAGIYAAGDVIGPPALASVSMEQGRVAACHAFGVGMKHAVDPLPPFGVYSLPEAAMVGMTEEKARASGVPYAVGRGWFTRNTRARIAGATEGFIKLVFRREDRVLLGVHIVGDIASELIHLGQMVASHARPIDDFIHATFNVPTYSELYKYAAYDGLQQLG